MAIISMNEINKVATELVAEFISKGYLLSPTMSGHQGEEYKVDLYKGDKVIRIYTDKGRSKKYNNERVFFISVKMFENVKVLNSMTTLWNNSGKELFYCEYLDFYSHGNKGNTDIYFDNYEEYKIAVNKQENRLRNNYENGTIFELKNYDKIIKIINNRKGYKSVRKNQITKVECNVNKYSKRKYYLIKIEGKKSLFFEL